MESGKNTLSIVALVLGIVGIALDFYNIFAGVIAGIIGIVIAVKARNTEDAKGLATGGFVCSIVAVALGGVMLICTVCAIGLLATSLSVM